MLEKENATGKRSPPAAQPKPERNDYLKYLALVEKIARGLARRLPQHIEFHDLFHSGVVGLLEAGRRYDPAKGVPFEFFATYRIAGKMIEYLRALDIAPRSYRKKIRDLNKVKHAIEQRVLRSASADEIAMEIGLDGRELPETIEILSLEEYPDLIDGKSIFESGDSTAEQHLMEEKLARALEELPLEFKDVIEWYFFNEYTQKEISEMIGMSEGRVCQILKDGLKLLKYLLTHKT